MDLPSSWEVALTMGQVPCEFRVDWPWVIFQGKIETRGQAAKLPQVCKGGAQPAAPDMIWHIYSGQCCFKGEGGIHLTSSWHTSPHPGQGPLPVSSGLHQVHFLGEKLRQGVKQPSSPRFVRAVHRGWLRTWFGTFYSHLHYSLGDGATHSPSSGEVALTMGQVPCESGGDWSKYSGSYPWGVCPGPWPLKNESGGMERPPAQTVMGHWGELRAMPLPTPRALAGPGEKSQVLVNTGWQRPTLPLIV